MDIATLVTGTDEMPDFVHEEKVGFGAGRKAPGCVGQHMPAVMASARAFDWCCCQLLSKQKRPWARQATVWAMAKWPIPSGHRARRGEVQRTFVAFRELQSLQGNHRSAAEGGNEGELMG
jgi:hypothetical protein